MIATGRVLAVTTIPLGDELAAPVAAGATTITVTDAADFNEDGGSLWFAEAEVIEYLTVDDETGVITLAAPTTVAGDEGDVVQVWDTDASAVSMETVAHVEVEGETFDSDALEALVPHTLIPYLPEGFRDGPGEFVSMEWQGEDLYLLDILNREPQYDTALLPAPGNNITRSETAPANPVDGDLWYDISPLDGTVWEVSAKQLTGNVATLTVEEGHDVQVGWEVAVNVGDPAFDSSENDTRTVTAVTATTVSFASANPDVALTPVTGTVQGIDVGAPANVPYIYDVSTSSWVLVSDPAVDLSLSDLESQVENNAGNMADLEAHLVNVEETAFSAQDIATSADGRVSISDYEPDVGDVFYVPASGGDPIPRNPGSVWFTRTRARINYCTNPSFEVDAAGWNASGASVARFDPADPTVPVGGQYALRITNTASGSHSVSWAGGTPGLHVEAGQTWAISAFALAEGANTTGSYAAVRFYDSSDTLIEEATGAPVVLATDDWLELEITVTAPVNAVAMETLFYNPNHSAVWLLDGVMVEMAEYTGRYFDGRSFDASWEGTADASRSLMEGGKVTRVYELYDSGWVLLHFTGSTTENLNASSIDYGILDGGLLGDNSVDVDKMKTNMVVASEALAAGDLVHVWDNGGLFMVRKASAAGGYAAHGFVLYGVSTGEAVHVYTEGYNPLMTGLTPGRQFLSTTAGRATGTMPSATGNLVQRIGVASDETTLHFTPESAIRLT